MQPIAQDVIGSWVDSAEHVLFRWHCPAVRELEKNGVFGGITNGAVVGASAPMLEI